VEVLESRGRHRYTSQFGSVTVLANPGTSKSATRRTAADSTDHDTNNTTSFTPILPFSFVRRAADYSRAWTPCSPCRRVRRFSVARIVHGLDKRGQKVVLWTDDANGIQNPGMYKPSRFL